MRQDFNAIAQMPSQFTDQLEKGLWDKTNRPLSEIVHSFSGHERNHLFLNLSGQQFEDISLISGVDSPADGRVFSITDFDRDGFVDFAVVNSNKPLLQVFRNRIGEIQAGDSNSKSGKFIAIRLVGGNQAAEPSELSNRDGIGARITVKTSESTLYRAVELGEGLAAQNSSVKLIGVGNATIESLRIQWPSGKETIVENQNNQLDHAKLVTIYEKKQTGGPPFGIAPYLPKTDIKLPKRTKRSRFSEQVSFDRLGLADSIPNSAELIVVSTMATWCESCIKHLPQFEWYDIQLRGQIKSLALPIDPEDTRKKLAEFARQHEPLYQILDNLSETAKSSLRVIIESHTDADVLPASLVFDRSGRLLHAEQGVPSVSKLKSILQQITGSNESGN